MRKNKFLLIIILLALVLFGCADDTSTTTAEPNNSAAQSITSDTPPSEDNEDPITTLPAKDAKAVYDAPQSPNQPAPGEIANNTPAAKHFSTDAPAEEDAELHCTISINCSSINDHLEDLDQTKTSLVPQDGWILAPTEVSFYEGENVFNVLLRTCKQNKIHMEYKDTPVYNSAYICGIGNLYEFDCGDLSGWMYAVNGTFPNYGCSLYELKDGDKIEFIYTCDLGESEQASVAQ